MLVSLFIVIRLFLLDIIVTSPSFTYQGVVFYVPNKYSIHAEKDAITKIKDKTILPDCKIYIGKIINNEIHPCGPCEMCSQLIQKYDGNKIWAF
jgi:cytidine deaminase